MGIIQLLDGFIQGVINGVTRLGELMKAGFFIAFAFVKEGWANFKDWIKNWWQGFIDSIKERVDKFNEFLGKIGTFILEKLPAMIGKGVQKILDWFQAWFGSGGKLRAVIEGFMDNMIGKFLNGLEKVKSLFKTAFSTIMNFLKGFVSDGS